MTMKLSDLKGAQYNPRRISDEALKGLGYSLKEFGDLSGIVFNTRTGNLVAGHQRVKALQAQYGDLAIEKGHIHANGDLFSVRLVDWPKEKELAANVAANSPTIQGEFTEDLQTLLDSIQVDLPEVFAELQFENLFREILSPDELGTDFVLPEGDRAPFQQMTFTLADAQAEMIKKAISYVQKGEDFKYMETNGNENSNGNALTLIVKQWAEQKKLSFG